MTSKAKDSEDERTCSHRAFSRPNLRIETCAQPTRAVTKFFHWCEWREIDELPENHATMQPNAPVHRRVRPCGSYTAIYLPNSKEQTSPP